MTILQLSLISALSIPGQVVWPSLAVEQSAGPTFYRIETVARCNPLSWNRWNPVSASWDVRAGLRIKPIEIHIGHISEHGVGRNDSSLPVESMDYVGIKYEVKL